MCWHQVRRSSSKRDQRLAAEKAPPFTRKQPVNSVQHPPKALQEAGNFQAKRSTGTIQTASFQPTTLGFGKKTWIHQMAMKTVSGSNPTRHIGITDEAGQLTQMEQRT